MTLEVKCSRCLAIIGMTWILPETPIYCSDCAARYKELFKAFEESESPESMVLTSPLLPSSQDKPCGCHWRCEDGYGHDCGVVNDGSDCGCLKLCKNCSEVKE